MFSRARMNLRSIGLGVHLPNHTSRTTSSLRNGGKIGAFRFIAGTECVRTISNGGASVCVLLGVFSTSFASVTCLEFIASTHFPGDRGRTNNFYPLIGSQASRELTLARPISHHAA